MRWAVLNAPFADFPHSLRAGSLRPAAEQRVAAVASVAAGWRSPYRLASDLRVNICGNPVPGLIQG